MITTNKTKWRRFSFAIILSSFLMMFVNPVLGSSSFYTTYLPDIFGWDRVKITLPFTVGMFAKLFVSFFLAGVFTKYDARKVTSIGALILAAAMFLMAHLNASYTLFFIAAMLQVVGVAILTLSGSFVLCGNWFNKKLGTVLGIVSIGAPLSNGFLMNILVRSIASYSDVTTGFTYTMNILGFFCLGLAVLFYLIIRGKPEDVGLFPDGADSAPVLPAEDMDTGDAPWNFKRVFTSKHALFLALGFGCLNFVTSGVMSVFIRSLMETGMETVKAANYLTIASALAIPISFASGIVDDKVGTRTATLITSVLYIILGVSMAIVTKTGNTALILIAAIGIGFGVGTVPNLHASFTARVFGRKNMMSGHRYAYFITSCVTLFVDTIMAAIYEMTGAYTAAFLLCAGLAVVAFVLLFFCNKSFSNDYIAAHDGDSKIR